MQKKKKKKDIRTKQVINWVFQQNKHLEKLLRSMLKHNSQQIGLQQLLLK